MIWSAHVLFGKAILRGLDSFCACASTTGANRTKKTTLSIDFISSILNGSAILEQKILIICDEPQASPQKSSLRQDAHATAPACARRVLLSNGRQYKRPPKSSLKKCWRCFHREAQMTSKKRLTIALRAAGIAAP